MGIRSACTVFPFSFNSIYSLHINSSSLFFFANTCWVLIFPFRNSDSSLCIPLNRQVEHFADGQSPGRLWQGPLRKMTRSTGKQAPITWVTYQVSSGQATGFPCPFGSSGMHARLFFPHPIARIPLLFYILVETWASDL